MSAPLTHIVFDLDGTLLNTLDDLADAGNHVCSLMGWPTFSHDAYRFKVGNGIHKLIERIVPAEFAGDAPIMQRALDEFRSYYAAHKEDHTAPYPGIAEMLDEMRARGLTLAVLTNKDHAAAAPLVERYLGSGRFALVQGHVDPYPPKPDAGITRHLLEQLGADAATTLYVGDSSVDVACGHNVGMRVAGVAWGFRGRNELACAGADFIVDTPAELCAIARVR
ncbi:HAD family hydrolase [Collinsella tanakaei]|uniref:HAD family hydrolase n=1 Tax=Collinsella tanakaei TaxID=626935 RepID=UPI001956F642|nr:HAD family hydrolase [Collinsella tanakaei]MBM6756173.1 HAD family hydrolase [Collinsella tanakaei]MBM6867950.1 HAD family hydrolase [Collinsella tanakaei]